MAFALEVTERRDFLIDLLFERFDRVFDRRGGNQARPAAGGRGGEPLPAELGALGTPETAFPTGSTAALPRSARRSPTRPSLKASEKNRSLRSFAGGGG